MVTFNSLGLLLATLLGVSFAQEHQQANSSIEVNPHYAQLLNYSMLFYEAQRSGKLPENNRIPW
jgi:endoglucanase